MTRNQQHLDSKIRLPDFFVPGAMKSGTTTLCAILDRHPDIFMSKPKEPLFFNRDDIWVHPNFFVQRQEQWLAFDWERNRTELLEEYSGIFEGAAEGQRLGEGSSTYMASKKAADRIAEVKPSAKFIFMLRDPVSRAYSTYWHLVRTGRAIYSFERQIQFEPHTILQRGLYKEQIEYYLSRFPREQMLFCIFEKFVRNMQHEIDRICAFLGTESKIDVDDGPLVKNVAKTPRFIRVHLILNALSRGFGADMVSFNIERNKKLPRKISLSLIRRLQRMNLTFRHYPPMNSKTRIHLEKFYQRENNGLGEIITVDLKYWGGMREI